MEKDRSDILPGHISSITTQKNNHRRYSIFVNDQFLVGVSESTLADYNLSKGSRISLELYGELLQAENRESVTSHSYRLLSRRDHSRGELHRKLKKKGEYPDALISEVLDELEEKEYLDDAEFAYRYACDKIRLNRWGPFKIRSELARKGVKRSDIDEGIDKAFGEVDKRDILFELVEKNARRFRRETDSFKRKRKVFDYLRRKGYTSETITRYLEKLVNSVS